jgi:acetoin:2,6-dichlorophenolindophenol oxidoreductase subunit alpha
MESKLTKDEMMLLYVNLVRTRKLDEVMVGGLLAGKVGGHWTSQFGQEAVGVGATTFLRRDDYLLYGHRGHGITTTIPKGLPPKAFIAEHYGRDAGGCHGVGLFREFDADLGIVGLSGTLGGNFVVAAGLGIGAKMRGKGQVVICNEGDGTYGRGTFHECALMSANWKLPIVWGIENNQYMIYSHVSELYPKENMADLAFGYGMPGIVVDGQDVAAVAEAYRSAIERARAGEGPSLIECKTYRIQPHVFGMADLRGSTPRPQEEIDAWKNRDPIDLFEKRLLEEGVITKADIDRIHRDAKEEMEEAERFASESPPPDPELLQRALYAE